MPSVKKRPSSSPTGKVNAKTSVLKKPASAKATAMVDWSSWAKKGEGEKEGEEQELEQPEEEEAEENSSDTDTADGSLKGAKQARGSLQVLTPGVNAETGEKLSTNCQDPYSPKQKYVMDKLMETNSDIQKHWDTLTSRSEKRQFVNSLIPKEVSYNARLDPEKATAVMHRAKVLSFVCIAIQVFLELVHRFEHSNSNRECTQIRTQQHTHASS